MNSFQKLSPRCTYLNLRKETCLTHESRPVKIISKQKFFFHQIVMHYSTSTNNTRYRRSGLLSSQKSQCRALVPPTYIKNISIFSHSIPSWKTSPARIASPKSQFHQILLFNLQVSIATIKLNVIYKRLTLISIRIPIW